MDEELRRLERAAATGDRGARSRYYSALERAGYVINLRDVMYDHPDPAARQWPAQYNSSVEAWLGCTRADWMVWALCRADRVFSARLRQICRDFTSLFVDRIQDMQIERLAVHYHVFGDPDGWDHFVSVAAEPAFSLIDQMIQGTRPADFERIRNNIGNAAINFLERRVPPFSIPEIYHQVGILAYSMLTSSVSDVLQRPGLRLPHPLTVVQSVGRAFAMLECVDSGDVVQDVDVQRCLDSQFSDFSNHPVMAHLVRDRVPLPFSLTDPEATT